MEQIKTDVRELFPIRLILAIGNTLLRLWDNLIGTYHYLGCRNLLGRRLKYLAFSGKRPIAALSWSAPALKLHVRDRYIGWSDEQRKMHLDKGVNNSRFLVLPWVKSPNLASHILALNIRRIKKDWKNNFGIDLIFLEAFTDPRFFNGICYKAANWKYLGQSRGYGKQGEGYSYHGKVKDVYFYALEREFREIIGCQKKQYEPFQRPPQSQKKMEELKMLLEHCEWNRSLAPVMDLDGEDLKNCYEEFISFHEQFHGFYGRKEHHRLGLAYLGGLLSNSEAKSCEPIAIEMLGKSSVRSVQSFMKNYRWDHDAAQSSHQEMLSEKISHQDGMISVDSSEFVKQGKESVGVARQYCGRLGKVENSQSGVFVAYSSKKGYGLLSGRLYMPEKWFSDEYAERRKKTMVPEDLIFKTKPQIASELINDILESNWFSVKWIGCDTTFGADIAFLNSLPKEMYYFASVSSDTRVFLEKPKVGIPPYKGRGPRPTKEKVLPGEPKPMKVKDIIESGKIEMKKVILSEGAKGPVIAEIGRIRVYRSKEGLPADESVWLIIRRDDDGKTRFALSNAPEEITFEELCHASIMRWPIEQCFKEGKGQIGMADYEHRSWPAWHRHMLFVFLGLHFLLSLRINLKKKPHA